MSKKDQKAKDLSTEHASTSQASGPLGIYYKLTKRREGKKKKHILVSAADK